MNDAATKRERFGELHAASALFLMPNPWDVGSAKLLQAAGFEALATTSQGFAWSLGKLDMQVTRDELVAHVAQLAASVDVPLNVDSERCFPDDPGGVAETVRLLGEAGAAGCSIEDYDPKADAIDDLSLSVARVAEAAGAAHSFDPPVVLTARAENHLRGVDDLDDTIERLVAYRDAGADCVYAPWLLDLGRIERVVREVGVPVNVLAAPDAPPAPELERAGVRRVSTGSLLAGAAYAALERASSELREAGTSEYARARLATDAARRAFDPG